MYDRELTSSTTTNVAFRLFVDSVIDYAIFTLDQQGNITSWNKGAQRAKGYTADEIIGQHFSVFLNP
jgi:PAS domain S-box-containing protein